MAIDSYKIESRYEVLLVTFQKGTAIHPDLLIKAIDCRYSIDETGQRNSVWDLGGICQIKSELLKKTRGTQ